MMRVLTKTVQLFLLFALIGRFVEAMGAVTCECNPECWCKKPGLSLFRWVFPAAHNIGPGCG